MFVNNMQLELITLLSMNKYTYIWIIYSKVCIMFEMCYVLLRESNEWVTYLLACQKERRPDEATGNPLRRLRLQKDGLGRSGADGCCRRAEDGVVEAYRHRRCTTATAGRTRRCCCRRTHFLRVRKLKQQKQRNW